MIETEIKVFVPPSAWEEALRSHGLIQTTPRLFENNFLYDTPEGELARRGCILRARRYGRRSYLTFKQPTTENEAIGFKVRREWTVPVKHFTDLRRILYGLGFRVWFRYQKYRTCFRWNSVALAADETPIGFFVELEGEPSAIEACISQLNWGSFPRSSENYYTLFVAARAAGRVEGPHMIFPTHRKES